MYNKEAIMHTIYVMYMWVCACVYIILIIINIQFLLINEICMHILIAT